MCDGSKTRGAPAVLQYKSNVNSSIIFYGLLTSWFAELFERLKHYFIHILLTALGNSSDEGKTRSITESSCRDSLSDSSEFVGYSLDCRGAFSFRGTSTLSRVLDLIVPLDRRPI